MRRKDREILEEGKIEEIFKKEKICRLGISGGELPYIVPLNYGYSAMGGKRALFFHCAKQGRKIELLLKNPKVSFEIDGELSIISGDEPCDYSAAYHSIMGSGMISFAQTHDEKAFGLTLIMHQVEPDQIYSFDQTQTEGVCVLKLEIEELTAKANQ